MNDILTRGSKIINETVVNEDYKILCQVVSTSGTSCICNKVFDPGAIKKSFLATIERGVVFPGMYVTLYRSGEDTFSCFPAYPLFFVADNGDGTATANGVTLALEALGSPNFYGAWQQAGRVYLAQRVGNTFFAYVQGYGSLAVTDEITVSSSTYDYVVSMGLDAFGQVVDFSATAESAHPADSMSDTITLTTGTYGTVTLYNNAAGAPGVYRSCPPGYPDSSGYVMWRLYDGNWDVLVQFYENTGKWQLSINRLGTAGYYEKTADAYSPNGSYILWAGSSFGSAALSNGWVTCT